MLNIAEAWLGPCKQCLSLMKYSLNVSRINRAQLEMSTKIVRLGLPAQYQSIRCQFTKSEPKEGVNSKHQVANEETNIELENSDKNIQENVNISHLVQPQSKTKLKTKRSKPVSEREWLIPEGYDTGIKIFNSLTRKKEPLILPNGRIASWYTCGPTVYDHAHIGHASSYIRTDIIRRVMMNLFNIDVVMVMGITDIDDKIIHRSKELKLNFKRMGRQYEQSFIKDMDLLKVMRPTVYTRVTDHIPHIIRFTHQLVEMGKAYVTPSGSVYFDIDDYGRYGRLWTHSMDTEIREPVDKEKKSARDFALWKAAKPDEPYWISPWGKGRPGWHIECSTMASTVFGHSLDIHSGGDDLRFPHHENEMAQSESCFGCNQWTNYWMHTGHLHLKNDKNKMSKSLSNTMRVSNLLERYSANQFRIFCMLRPYRNTVEYSDDAMLKAVNIHKHWTSFLHTADAYIKGHFLCKPINEAHLMGCLQATKDKVEKALMDDFDTAKSITAVEELVHQANVELDRQFTDETDAVVSTVRSPGVIASVVAYVERIMELFGVDVPKKNAHSSMGVSMSESPVIDTIVKFRNKVRRHALDELENAKAEKRTVEVEAACSSAPKVKPSKPNVKPLLEACDNVRDDLRVYGILVNDHGKNSSWQKVEK